MLSFWEADERRSGCHLCKVDFSLFFRRHHCRICGSLVCSNCSRKYIIAHHGVSLTVRCCVKKVIVDGVTRGNCYRFHENTFSPEYKLPQPFHHVEQHDKEFLLASQQIFLLSDIPSSERARVWPQLAQGCPVKAVIRSTEEDYADRISKALATLDEEKKAWALKSVYEPIPKTSLMHAHRKIGKDLDRTFPALGKAFSPELVSSMSRILLTFAHMHGEIGYVQGFNYICGTLLLAIHDNTADSKRQQKQIMASYEATAFAMFNTIVIQVQDCFLPGMAGLYEIRARVTNGLERYLPELGAHIKAIDVDPVLFLQPWVVSLFTYATFCREFSYRIIGFLLTWTYCDCHAEAVKPTLTGDETLDASRRMYEGIARVSLAILHNHKTTLLAATQDNFCAYLREITTEETAESAEEVVRKAVTLGQWKDIIND